MEDKTRKLIIYLIVPLLLLTCAVFIADSQKQRDFLMHADFLDVGQGDSIFIQTYQGNQIVIDGGPDDKVLSQLSKVMPFWDRSIDLLILTHPDADHVTGLVEILKRYQVKKVIVTGVIAPTAIYEAFADSVEQKQIEKIQVNTGDRIWLDSSTVFDIYSPPPGIETNKSISTNNTSIFGKLSFGKTRIFLTGDADSIVEDSVRAQGFDVHSDILKVGHHGSKHSTSAAFVQAVGPSYAVVQVSAKNTYGHPTREALDNLTVNNVKIFRTDTDHLIKFTSDGVNLIKK